MNKFIEHNEHDDDDDKNPKSHRHENVLSDKANSFADASLAVFLGLARWLVLQFEKISRKSSLNELKASGVTEPSHGSPNVFISSKVIRDYPRQFKRSKWSN